MQVPFFRPSIGEDEIEAVGACLRSGWLTTGPRARTFEEAFAREIGGGVTALAVNSATAALHLGLEALGVGPGDEVIVPTMTFTATAEVVRYLGAEPVFVDMNPDTFCIEADDVAERMTAKTRVIMPVHFAGRPCPMTDLRTLADGRGVAIMDDAAHAAPASHAGAPIGACGAEVTAFSFYANKTMTTGEGGMLVTRDPRIAARVRTMRLHGIDRDVFNRFVDPRASWIYDVVAPGFKYNMTDVAAALGEVQLRRIDEFHRARTDRVARYDAAFADLPVELPPRPAEGDIHSWHLYILRLRADAPLSRDAFIDRLRELGIGTSVHYRPLHQLTVWKSYCAGRTFPHADAYFERCVSLPLFMAMTDEEQDYVIDNVRRILSA